MLNLTWSNFCEPCSFAIVSLTLSLVVDCVFAGAAWRNTVSTQSPRRVFLERCDHVLCARNDVETVAFGQIQVANSIDEFPTETDALIVGQNYDSANSLYLLADSVRLMQDREKTDDFARFCI